MKEAAGSDAEDDADEEEDDWAAWEVDSDSDSDSSDAADGWVDVSSDEEHALEISDSEDEKEVKKKGKTDEEIENEDDGEESEDDADGKKDTEGMEVDTPEVPADLLQSLAATKVCYLLCHLLVSSHNGLHSFTDPYARRLRTPQRLALQSRSRQLLKAQASRTTYHEVFRAHTRGRGRPTRRSRHPRTAQEGESHIRGAHGVHQRGARGAREVWVAQGEEEQGGAEQLDESREEAQQAVDDGYGK